MKQSNILADSSHTANSVNDQKNDCQHSPVIILPGINHSPTFLYDKNDNPVFSGKYHIGGTLLIPNKEVLTKYTAFKLILRALASIVIQNDAGLEKFIYTTVSDILKYQRCDQNGNHIENLKTKRWNYSLKHMTKEEIDWTYRMVPMKSLVDEIGEDHVYFFTYNLVGDPMDSADDLNEYIEAVKKQTGHDKVTFIPISLGGTILTAYLEKYGHNNIDQIVNIVACLNGTDIVADFYERKWRLDDYYLYHRFIANIFTEFDGVPLKGDLINTLLHIFPRKAVNGLLSGSISAILDGLMLNCPQFWAMLPSYRYDKLADRYLSDNSVLKARTDRFQKARVNLSKNLLAATADGVRINSIACANLDLGEQMYTYFNIVASAENVNSDGIVNLSSASLGATGAPHNKKLSDIEYSVSCGCENSEHNHISHDNMVDTSTALFPENTWIFLNQHHEVGRNDVVLNLAKSIVLGKIKDIYSDPINYPQFNGTCNTQNIRRWKLPDAYKVDTSKLNNTDKADLNSAIAEAEAVLKLTVADQPRVEAAEKRLIAALQEVEAEGYKNINPKKKSAFTDLLNTVSYALSKSALFLFGGGSPVDRTVKILKRFLIKKEVVL